MSWMVEKENSMDKDDKTEVLYSFNSAMASPWFGLPQSTPPCMQKRIITSYTKLVAGPGLLSETVAVTSRPDCKAPLS